MVVLGAVGLLKTAAPMLKHWCESCFNGTHKSCEDHKADETNSHESVNESVNES